jgi:DNA primase
VDAVQDLAQQVGMTVPEDERSADERRAASERKAREATLTDVLAQAAAHYRKQLKRAPRAVDYLKRRGLSGEIAARFGLGYAPDGWRTLANAFPSYDDPLLVDAGLVIAPEGEDKRYDRFRDRVMFPIRSVQGEVIGFGGRVLDKGEPKYLNSPETPVFSKGRELYGLHEARQSLRERGYVLVVEGYMDVVALAQLGFPNAVATLGTACTEDHVRKLFRFTDSVVFSFDGDAAGRRAAGRALEAALPHASDLRTVRFLFLPPEHDPDSYVREHGSEAFERCVAEAVPLSRQLLEAAKEGCDLGSAEGRARFLAQAKPLVLALPEGALRSQVMVEAGELARLSAADVAALWQPQGTTAPAVRERPPRPFGAQPFPAAMPGAPRRARASRRVRGPADNVGRLLLMRADWWDQLGAAELELLHEAPGWHGELFRWLERQWHDQGAQHWPALREALAAEPWAAEAAALVDGADSQLEPLLEDLQSALRQMQDAKAREAALRLLGRV